MTMRRRGFLLSSIAAFVASALPVKLPLGAVAEAATPAAEPFLGTLMMSGVGTVDPLVTMWTDKGWMACVGQVLNAAEYPRLQRALDPWGFGDLKVFLPDCREWPARLATSANTIEFWNEIMAGRHDELAAQADAIAAPIVPMDPLRDKTADDAAGI